MSSKEPSSLLVTKANDLISASYRLTLQEQRLLLAAIAQVDPRKPMPSKSRLLPPVSLRSMAYRYVLLTPISRRLLIPSTSVHSDL